MINRKVFLGMGLALAQSVSSIALAQTGPSYPDRPVRIIVPFAPGAGTDAMGRLVAQKLGEVLGGTFVVENRAGASGAIGTQFVAQQPADGYTLLLIASPFTTVAASLPVGAVALVLEALVPQRTVEARDREVAQLVDVGDLDCLGFGSVTVGDHRHPAGRNVLALREDVFDRVRRPALPDSVPGVLVHCRPLPTRLA